MSLLQQKTSIYMILWSFSPPEFVTSKQVSLLVLPKAESSIDVLQVSGEAEARQPLGITPLQSVCFVDPHLISCVDKADNSSNNACFNSVGLSLSVLVYLYNADKRCVCLFLHHRYHNKMCHKPQKPKMEKYLKSGCGTSASSNISVHQK